MGNSQSEDAWNQLPPPADDGSAFYLNVLVTTRQSAFHEHGTVAEDRRGPDLGFDALQGASSLSMHDAITGNTATHEACDEVCGKLEQQLEDMGLQALCHVVIRSGGLGVVYVSLKHCDGDKLLKQSHGSSWTDHFDFGHKYWSGRWASGRGAHATQEAMSRAPRKIQELGQSVVDPRGLKVEVKARSEQEEQDFIRSLSMVMHDEMQLMHDYPNVQRKEPKPWYAFWANDDEEPPHLPPPEADGSAFYLNMLVAHTYVLEMEKRKVDDDLLGPDLGFQSMQGMSRQGMTDVIRGDQMTSGLCDSICSKLGQDLEDMGVQANAEKIFNGGALAIYRVHITYLHGEQLHAAAGAWDLGRGRWSSGRGSHATSKAMNLVPYKIQAIAKESLDSNNCTLEILPHTEAEEPAFVEGLSTTIHSHGPYQQHPQDLGSMRTSLDSTAQGRHNY
mmetsp:Transcript_65080/g.121275  ORF Transcript_65080/g.121275 Transcript_65080/m.121275 type:complete len:447 (-) Transcript_65080:68-1408(-)